MPVARKVWQPMETSSPIAAEHLAHQDGGEVRADAADALQGNDLLDHRCSQKPSRPASKQHRLPRRAWSKHEIAARPSATAAPSCRLPQYGAAATSRRRQPSCDEPRRYAEFDGDVDGVAGRHGGRLPDLIADACQSNRLGLAVSVRIASETRSRSACRPPRRSRRWRTRRQSGLTSRSAMGRAGP